METKKNEPPLETITGFWFPLTFGGVALAGRQSAVRFWSFAILMAAACAACLVWFLNTTWNPVIEQSISRMMDGAEMRGGAFKWPGTAPVVVLGYNSFLGIVVNLDTARVPGQVADLQVELTPGYWRTSSLLGYLSWPYPKSWTWNMNRTNLDPWWGAWKPTAWAVAGLLVVFCLLATWSALAVLYSLPIRLAAKIFRRPTNWRDARRMAFAALWPGAIWTMAALGIYGLQHINLVIFLVAFGLHFVVGWIYLLLAVFWLPKTTSASRKSPKNPFGDQASAKPSLKPRENPFAGRG